MPPKVVTRFAPSPTGYLHLGGLRTALYSYLWAKKNKGEFILRIEDTDQKRKVEDAEQKLIDTLNNLGITADRTYRQSDRLTLYQKAAQQLIDTGFAYKCFCSEQRLEELRARQSADHQVPRYDGHCRNYSAADIAQHEGQPFVIRFKIPEHRTIHTRDLIRGTIEVQSKDLDDFVLLKSDSWPTYHLAVVVDDSDMGVTHVIRAEEWLPSLPKHQLLYEAFGYEVPVFIHLPLLLNPDKSKLSKRQGDVAVEDYLAKGYVAAALINYVALLGWHPANDREFFSLNELITEFDLDRLQKSGAIFDKEKLNWYNAHYIKQYVIEKGREYQDVLQFIQTQVLPDAEARQLERLLKVYSVRLENLSSLKDLSLYIYYLPEYDPSLLIFKKSTRELTQKGLDIITLYLEKLEWEKGESLLAQLETGMKQAVTVAQLSFGDALWPTRVALSGLDQSPSPAELAYILGKEESLKRLRIASEKLKSMV